MRLELLLRLLCESADLDTEEDWNIAQAALLARRETEFSAPRYMTLDEDV